MLPDEQSIVDLYRFAFLLTGNRETAETILLKTLRDGAGQVEQFRNQGHCSAWIVATLRERCNQSAESGSPTISSEAANNEVGRFATSFSQLEEPGRSALALFYTDLFSPNEIANLLHLKHDELAEYLAKARESLNGAAFSEKTFPAS